MGLRLNSNGMITKDKLKDKIAAATNINDIETIADEIMAVPVPWFLLITLRKTQIKNLLISNCIWRRNSQPRLQISLSVVVRY